MTKYLRLVAPIVAIVFLVADSLAQPPSMGGGRSRGEGGMRGGPGGGMMGGPGGGGMMGGGGGMMGGPGGGGGMMGGRGGDRGGSGGFSRGGGGDRSAGGDRGGSGRDRSGGGRDRGFGPPSGEGGQSAEDRFARFEGMLRGFDSNKDGVIDPNEVPEERRRFLGFIGARMGVDFSKPVSIDKLKKKASQQFGGKSNEPEPLVPGFGVEEEEGTVLAFGEREPTASSTSSGGSSARGGAGGEQDARAQGFADMMMRRYDRDGNGVLERDKGEWDGIRGDPNEIDRNNDGRIDRDEMIARVSAYMGGRGGNREDDRGRGDRGGGDRGDGDRGGDREMDTNSGRRSYRFLSASERLPEGLPSWFEERDRDQDGQVTMAEYSSSWTDSKAREFLRYDINDDGVITPEECLIGMSRPGAGPPSSEGPGPAGPSSEGPSPGAETKPAEKPASSSADKPWWMK